MSSKQMRRGKIQALYRYLPDEWIDFAVRGDEREQYIAKVDRWNTEKLVGINAARLLRAVNDATRDFCKNGATAQGFGEELKTENCDILTPRVSDVERGIVANVSPLVFYCKKCFKVHKFRTFEDYCQHRKCRKCGGKLSQFRQIFFCKCGHASDVYPTCKEHGDRDLRWDKGYNFVCDICNRKIQISQTCNNCKTRLGAKVALDPTQFLPFSLSLIDLIDEELESFIDNTDYGRLMVMAYWLGLIDKSTLYHVIKNGIVTDQEKYQREYEKLFNFFVTVLGEENAKIAAKASTEEKCGIKYLEIIDKVRTMLNSSDIDSRYISEQILEYGMVAGLDNAVTIEDAVRIAETLNTNANPDKYIELSNKFGIKHVVACDDIPFISCTYGYTRVESEPKEGVVLKALKPLNNDGKKNVLAVKTKTEGVLFEFDRKRIVEWLLRNSFICEEEAPKDYSDPELKMWFINNIKPSLISRFSNINQVSSEITYYIYRLIHSISHTLIRAVSELSGLGKDSLSEYIFPGVPAVLIYCQNSQGFNLGSLTHTFEAYYDRWLYLADKLAQKCVFDPICIERHKACTGCLYLNEISCEHFNKDLDRSLIIGHTNIETQNRLFGFWEEE